MVTWPVEHSASNPSRRSEGLGRGSGCDRGCCRARRQRPSAVTAGPRRRVGASPWRSRPRWAASNSDGQPVIKDEGGWTSCRPGEAVPATAGPGGTLARRPASSHSVPGNSMVANAGTGARGTRQGAALDLPRWCAAPLPARTGYPPAPASHHPAHQVRPRSGAGRHAEAGERCRGERFGFGDRYVPRLREPAGTRRPRQGAVAAVLVRVSVTSCASRVAARQARATMMRAGCGARERAGGTAAGGLTCAVRWRAGPGR